MSADLRFLGRLSKDKILNAKTDKIFACFQIFRSDLAIPSPNLFYEKLEFIQGLVREADATTGCAALSLDTDELFGGTAKH